MYVLSAALDLFPWWNSSRMRENRKFLEKNKSKEQLGDRFILPSVKAYVPRLIFKCLCNYLSRRSVIKSTLSPSRRIFKQFVYITLDALRCAQLSGFFFCFIKNNILNIRAEIWTITNNSWKLEKTLVMEETLLL